ncbi:MAG: V-type ATP synthase subunit E [Clostridia bacterium]|nr:V-type ATP synthase subunit E [Clostridia bacterium]
MTGLSKITDKIIAEANKDAQEILASADAECKRIAEEYKLKAQKIKADIEDKTEREAAAVISRAKSSAAMEQRNAALSAKSDLIDKAFNQARNELRSLPEDKYLDFLTSMLVSILLKQLEDEKTSRELYGDEDAPVIDRYEVFLSERDLARCGSKLIESLRRRLVGKSQADIVSKVYLSPVPAQIDGGLILRCGSVEINGSLSMLFEQLRPSLEVRVSRILFDNQ